MNNLLRNLDYLALGQRYEPEEDRLCYFTDGERKIDFVLCFSLSSEESERLAYHREKYMLGLKARGIQIEVGRKPDEGYDDGFIQFYKCHCPTHVILFYAEELNLPVPMKIDSSEVVNPNLNNNKGVIVNWSDIILKKLHLTNPFHQDVPCPPKNEFKAAFKMAKIDKYIGGENPSKLFSDAQRSRIAFEILETTPFGLQEQGEIGISRLLSQGSFLAAFPLHEALEVKQDNGEEEDDLDPFETEQKLNRRQIVRFSSTLYQRYSTKDLMFHNCFFINYLILREYWARWGKWYKYQPLDHIREYFGEKIGFYFAWLGHYTSWLFLPSIVGFSVFLYGLATISSIHNQDAIDTCQAKRWEYKMCPLCEEDLGCVYWDLKNSCNLATMSYLFDNNGTVFFAVFLSFWAVFFQEFWKRREAFLAYHWDSHGYEAEAEKPRPLFTAGTNETRLNPITSEEEPYFPPSKRRPRLFSGLLIVVTMISLVVIFLVGVIVYKLLIFRPLAQNHLTQHYAFQVASATGALLNLVCILILSTVYGKLAIALTDWEMHRTQTEYEDNLTFKVFVFQFVNFYSSIFYIAFFKGKLVGYPGHYTTMLKLRQEECAPGGCLMELAQQLFIIMVGKQIIGNVQEMVIPMIKAYLTKRKQGKQLYESDLVPRWEEDFYSLADNEGLFSEYLEMVIQFGFITIFVAAFPIAPLFALANNIFEIRIDSIKLVTAIRRPVAERAQDIGIWFDILTAIAQIAVISMYRDFRDNNGEYTRFYWHLVALKLGFVIVFEHFVFATNRLIDLLVPDVPEELDLSIQREAYLAKLTLADGNQPVANGTIESRKSIMSTDTFLTRSDK